MRELQRMEPTKAALLEDADLEDAGSGRVAGVAGGRYRATAGLRDVAEAFGRQRQGSCRLQERRRDDALALDGENLLRAFDMSGDIGPSKMTMHAQMTSYSATSVQMPSGRGIYDMSGALAGRGELS